MCSVGTGHHLEASWSSPSLGNKTGLPSIMKVIANFAVNSFDIEWKFDNFWLMRLSFSVKYVSIHFSCLYSTVPLQSFASSFACVNCIVNFTRSVSSSSTFSLDLANWDSTVDSFDSHADISLHLSASWAEICGRELRIRSNRKLWLNCHFLIK